MSARASSYTPDIQARGNGIWSHIWKVFWNERFLWLMALPGLLFFIVYKYLPMLGVVIAFKDYNLMLGIWDSKWVGLKHFYRIFENPDIGRIFLNTLIISFYQIVFAFTIPIFLAIMIHEVSKRSFKRVLQTVFYMPHFLSWVVVAGIFYLMFQSDGAVNNMLLDMGLSKIDILSNSDNFRFMLVLQVIWKESGWGTIIYLAALSSIDMELYEAAKMDGAGRLRQIWNITLPGIRSTIVVLFILRLGSVLDVGFEQIFLMLNPSVRDVGEVIETYVYQAGVVNGNFSFSTAVGLLKGLIGLIMIFGANKLAKRMGERGVF
ncbi:ABC transporter permease subunit [Paenibacillus sp. MER TA 81-3]|uniref:ABC transporter permease n=1 Tax=Paenibacillus sp. MER TA 81-3 TaxID=2939573 RepID=UPI00203EBDFB|nr:ABC transporter permease subunit [Paenibacillus sp. MER TA 81-3]MCM3339377.1 ABC transporter permease subunit [Paenibacillus sp. MER TA 81-3]